MKKTSPTPLPVAERLERWQAPTGKWLERGQTFRVEGRRGEWKFLAYVAGDDPHVEAVRISTTGPTSVRCIRPETITRVHRMKEQR